jgi:hypothetical protein
VALGQQIEGGTVAAGDPRHKRFVGLFVHCREVAVTI